MDQDLQTPSIDLSLIDDAPSNPNVMPEAKYRALVSAIGRVGFWQPIIVEPGEGGRYTMRDGHHRARALRELGWTRVPAVVVTPGTPADVVSGITLSHNGLRGEPDLTVVAGMLEGMQAAGWTLEELAITGLPVSEVEDLLSASAAESPDELLGGAGAVDEFNEQEPGSAARFVLEVPFENPKDLRRVKAALRKAAGGKGQPLARGLLRALALED